MKYFIDSKRPLDEIIDIEREMPMRVQIGKQIAKRFKAESVYFYADRVGMIFILELDDSEKLAEIIMLLRRAGLIPEAYPLVDGPVLNQILLDMAEMTD